MTTEFLKHSNPTSGRKNILRLITITSLVNRTSIQSPPFVFRILCFRRFPYIIVFIINGAIIFLGWFEVIDVKISIDKHFFLLIMIKRNFKCFVMINCRVESFVGISPFEVARLSTCIFFFQCIGKIKSEFRQDKFSLKVVLPV